MTRRPYTAILQDNRGRYSAQDCNASLDPSDARQEIEASTGCMLVALVPGTHTGGTRTFEAQQPQQDIYVDPFDTGLFED